MNTNPAAEPVTTERKTTELCSAQLHHGMRCMHPKRHDGDHECYSASGKPVRWK